MNKPPRLERPLAPAFPRARRRGVGRRLLAARSAGRTLRARDRAWPRRLAAVTYQAIIREGRAEGITRGLAEGIAATILELAEIRLGPLDDALVDRIAALPLAELEPLKSAVLRAPDDAALAALLAAAGRSTH